MNPTGIETTFPGTPRSRKAIWTGRILSGLAALFLTFDAAMKVLALPAAVEGTYPTRLSREYAAEHWHPAACLPVVYLIPRTALIGAVLWTGYLGGAIATHVRVGSPLFTHTLFPIYVAVLLWAGLWLRDRRVGALLASPSNH
jgi:DoxX-like family